MKLRSIKRQGGRRPAIPESERKLTVLPAEPAMTALFREIHAAKGAQADWFYLIPSGIAKILADEIAWHDSH